MAETNTNIQMPPAEQIAVDAIRRLAIKGYRSQLMKLSEPLLNEVARRLVTSGVSKADVLKWLNTKVDKEIDDNAFYSFAQRFSETCLIIRGEQAAAILMTELAADPNFDTDRLQEFNRNKVTQLIGQALVEAKNLNDLDDKKLDSILKAIQLANKRDTDKGKLALAKITSEQREAEMEVRLEKMKLELEAAKQKIEQAKAKFDQEVKAAKSKSKGGKISAEDLAEVREAIFGR